MPKGELSIAKDTESWLFFDNLKKKPKQQYDNSKGFNRKFVGKDIRFLKSAPKD